MEQYPEMVIELGSHTDSRGTVSDNQRLSQRRAASARKWLIVNGKLGGPRIKTVGYGKTVPLTASARLAERIDFLSEGDVLTDDFINSLPDEETRERAHFLNRRTEFKIIEGPTSIIIRRDVIERKVDAPNRGTEPRSFSPAPAAAPETDTITRFSSLYGQKDIKNLPILQFDRRELDLSDVKKGQKKSFEYTFTNTGEVPAKVMLIQACDCTTIEHNNAKVYQPGDSGVLKITFDSAEKEEDETIVIDIYLEQNDKSDLPILEMVEYSFRLLK
jgi:peptidoglycan-associated lipoprotein